MLHPALSNEEDPVLRAFLLAIPKVELHCHLFGTVRRKTFTEFNTLAGSPLTYAEIEGFYTRGEKPIGVLRVLRSLDAQLVKSADYLYQMVLEYLEDAASHNIRYSEFFWNPTGTAHVSGIRYPDALDAILRATQDAEKQFNIIGRVIPSIDREDTPEAAVEMVKWVTAYRSDEVAGIGIDYRETNRPPELFLQAFQDAKRAGLKTTAHAGEVGMPWTWVRTALDELKVDRIDHGYTVIDEPAFARECADRGIVFTVVPPNSHYIRTLPPDRWALDHPIRKMPGLGLKIHPNTDDPTLMLVNPTRIWLMMVRDFGFNLDDLQGFMHNGLDGAWIDDLMRRRWHEEWDKEFSRLRSEMIPAPRLA